MTPIKETIIEKMRLSGHSSAVYLQNKLKIEYAEAQKICDKLIFQELPVGVINNGCRRYGKRIPKNQERVVLCRMQKIG